MKASNPALTQATKILEKIGQRDLIEQWNRLSAEKRAHLSKQILQLDLKVLEEQKRLLASAATVRRPIDPFLASHSSGDERDKAAGEEAIAKGLAGCLIVAGGQGTRLGFDGPKGIFPVTPIRRKSLFQLFAEKAIAAGKRADRSLPIAIMTSEQNDAATRRFFETNHYFGLKKNDVSFFKQNTLPFLGADGRLLLEDDETLVEGPDGNGGALHSFCESGLFADWYQRGVRFLNFVLIDNPLADPFDAELIGFQLRTRSEITIKCTQKNAPEEKVGVLANENGRTVIVEYSELTEEEAQRRDEKGRLLFRHANLSLFSFTMDFVARLTASGLPMPLHKAFKAAKVLQPDGTTAMSDGPVAWKFERFIFDILPMADSVNALVYPRETCFAPLKNKSGPDSPETVAAALEASDRRALERITQTKCTAAPLEISQDFYYPTQDLIDRWEGRTVTETGYIEA